MPASVFQNATNGGSSLAGRVDTAVQHVASLTVTRSVTGSIDAAIDLAGSLFEPTPGPPGRSIMPMATARSISDPAESRPIMDVFTGDDCEVAP